MLFHLLVLIYLSLLALNVTFIFDFDLYLLNDLCR